MKVSIDTDCGKSPKREFLKQFNIAFAKGDVEFIMNSVTDDIQWNIIGDNLIKGKKEFGIEIEAMTCYLPQEITIQQIISHGKEGAVNGVLKFPNGNAVAFCDIVEFLSPGKHVIKRLTSYVIRH